MGNKHSSRRYRNRIKLSQSIIKEVKQQPSNITMSNIPSEEIMISDDERDLKLYFNCENNIYRQHNHHFLKKHLFQCEFSSPVKEILNRGGKVLDLGCGPATFLLDIAAQYPNSQFYGIDIEPIFPKEIKPYNLHFKITDMLKGLPFPDNEFDLVHMETILFSLKSSQVDFIINEMIRVLKPNGYIEFAETHMTCRYNGVGERLGQLLLGLELVANSYEADHDMVLKLPQLLTTYSSIKNINVEKKRKILGKNGGKLGIIIQDIYGWFNNSSKLFVRDACNQLNITKEEYDQLIEDSFNELNYTSPEVDFIRIYAQKRRLIL